MKTISVKASDNSANIRLTAQDVQVEWQSSVPTMSVSTPSFSVVIESSKYSLSIERLHEAMDTGLKQSLSAGTLPAAIDKALMNSVLIETRPVAIDHALRTQRLNRALQVGFFTPVQETSPRPK